MHHFAALRTSLPVALHREFETIDARSAHWARTYLPFPDDAARRRFTAEGHTRWTCLLFPTGASERVLAIANLTLLLFATDDALVAGSAGARRLLDAARAVLDDRPAGGDPWEPGLRAAWRPLRRAMGAAQRRRLATAILLLFRGAEEERRLRLRQQLPGYAEYLRLRHDSVGAEIYFVLTEYAIATDLSDVAAARALRGVLDAAAEHLILTNDLFSYAKEREAGDGMNAVAVLAAERGAGLPRVLALLRAAIEARERAFVCARTAALDGPLGARDDVRATLAALGHLLSGNLRWSETTPRYACADAG